jgi:peptidoglycan-associated lipoprotein
MKCIFLSHVEEDWGVALELAEKLMALGYSVWCYENDALPGPSYLLNTQQAIDECPIFLLLISWQSVASHQITKELEHAHEQEKQIIPVLLNISDKDYKRKMPLWAQIVGTNTSIPISAGKVQDVARRIGLGIQQLGFAPESAATAAEPHGKNAGSGLPAGGVLTAESQADGKARAPEQPTAAPRRWRRVLKTTTWFLFYALSVLYLVVAIKQKSDADADWFSQIAVSGWLFLLGFGFQTFWGGIQQSKYGMLRWFGRIIKLVVGFPPGDRWWWRIPKIVYIYLVSSGVLMGLASLAAFLFNGNTGNFDMDKHMLLEYAGFLLGALTGFRWLSLFMPSRLPSHEEKKLMKRATGFASLIFLLVSLGGLICQYESLDGERHWGIPASKDSKVVGYRGSVEQIDTAARTVLERNGKMILDNAVDNIFQARIRERNVWARITKVDDTVAQFEVQVRTGYGTGDVSLAAEIVKQIALQLTVSPEQTAPGSTNQDSQQAAQGETSNNANQDRERFKADSIYFDFESSMIKASEESKLQELATCLKDNKSFEIVIIEGNCDERNTERYSLSLGEARALAAREYLASLGVDPARLKTVTYGSAHPVDLGHDESAWKKNNRVDFILVTPK